MKRGFPALFGMVSIVFASGCAAAEGGIGASELALAEDFSSIEELSEHAPLIVQGIAVDSDAAAVEGTEFVVTEIDVSRFLKGSAEEVVRVRQDGDEYLAETYPVAPVLQAGTEYVLYLRPFELVAGEVTDEHVILGVGAFEVDGATLVLPEQAGYYAGFPDQTDLEEIEDLAQRSD